MFFHSLISFSYSGETNSSNVALCGPMTNRLISALLEENIVTSMQDNMEVEDCQGWETNPFVNVFYFIFYFY